MGTILQVAVAETLLCLKTNYLSSGTIHMDTKKIYLLVKIDGDIDFERKTILRAFTRKERADEELEKLENKYFCNISWIDYIKMLNRFAVESTEIFDEERTNPKKGGWLKRFSLEQLSAAQKEAYDWILHDWSKRWISEEQSSYANYTKARLHIDDDLYLYMNKLLCPLYENMTIAQIKETMLYYNKWRNELNSISYEIEETELEED